VFRELTRAAKGKAFSKVSQISKDMLKVIATPNPQVAKLQQKIAEFNPDNHSDASLQHWREALAALHEERDTDKQDTTDTCRFIAACFNATEITGSPHPAWLRLLLSPIFKDKVDPAVQLSPAQVTSINHDLNHWREVVQADAFRTLYGSCVNTAWNVFSSVNNLHRYAQLAYKPGIDAIAVHHLRFDLVQTLSIARGMPWSQAPLVLGVLAQDFKHYFSTYTARTRECIMEQNQFPDIRRRGQRAIHEGMTVAMSHQGKLTPEIGIGCELMGSAEACTFATAAFSGYNAILEKAGRGFRLPPSEEFGLPAICMSHLFGGDQCDDITIFSGGYQRSPKETIDDLEWMGRLTLEWSVDMGFVFSIDQEQIHKSKCVTFVIITDEFGFTQAPNINIWLPTTDGVTRVPMLPETEAFKMLGIMRAKQLKHQVSANTQASVNKTLSRLQATINDLFPIMAQAAYLRNSVTGGLRWIAEKAAIPWETIKAATSLEAAEARAVFWLSRSTSAAYIFTARCSGGCGQSSSENVVTTQGVVALLALLNNKHEYVSQLTRYTIEVDRLANCIPLQPGSRFFDWDLSKLAITDSLELVLSAPILITLRFVIQYGASIVFTDFDNTWRLQIRWRENLYITPCKDTIKHVIDDIFQDRWLCELINSPIDAAAQESYSDVQRANANLWRSAGSLPNAVVKTAVRAAIDGFPTGLNLWHWNLIPAPTCHCGAQYASISHISQVCPRVHWLIVERSKAVVDLCVQALSVTGSSNWSYVGPPGCLPPSFLLPQDWRIRLRAIPELVKSELTMVQHFLPDLILVSAAAGNKICVVIVDPCVCWGDTDTARLRKLRAYEPLHELMTEFLGDKCESITILPVPFTARGTPPPDWGYICQTLKIKIPAITLLKRIQNQILISLDSILKAWQMQHMSSTHGDAP